MKERMHLISIVLSLGLVITLLANPLATTPLSFVKDASAIKRENEANLTVAANDMEALDLVFGQGEELELVFFFLVKEGMQIDVWFMNDYNYTRFLNGSEFMFYIDGSGQQVIQGTKIVTLSRHDVYKLAFVNNNNVSVEVYLNYDINVYPQEEPGHQDLGGVQEALARRMKSEENLTVPANGETTLDFVFQDGEEFEIIYFFSVKEGLQIDVWLMDVENYTKLSGGSDFMFYIDGSGQQLVQGTKIVTLTKRGNYKLVLDNNNDHSVEVNLKYDTSVFPLAEEQPEDAPLWQSPVLLILLGIIAGIVIGLLIGRMSSRPQKEKKTSTRKEKAPEKKKKEKKPKKEEIEEEEPEHEDQDEQEDEAEDEEKPSSEMKEPPEQKMEEKEEEKVVAEEGHTPSFCGYCGKPIKTPFCQNCGKEME